MKIIEEIKEEQRRIEKIKEHLTAYGRGRRDGLMWVMEEIR